MGLAATDPAAQDLWIGEALATAAIEGERLDAEAVRSSVLRHRGLPAASAHMQAVREEERAFAEHENSLAQRYAKSAGAPRVAGAGEAAIPRKRT